jgi:hypothetical protein
LKIAIAEMKHASTGGYSIWAISHYETDPIFATDPEGNADEGFERRRG